MLKNITKNKRNYINEHKRDFSKEPLKIVNGNEITEDGLSVNNGVPIPHWTVIPTHKGDESLDNSRAEDEASFNNFQVIG